MSTQRVLIIGSSGLIGSEAALLFGQRAWDVHGIDNTAALIFLARMEIRVGPY